MAPLLLLSRRPPVSAVFPSSEMATDHPWRESPISSDPTNAGPCCCHTPFVRTNTSAPPPDEPTRAVFPSAAMATDHPMSLRLGLFETSFGPC